MLAALPLPLMTIAAVIIALLMLAGLRGRSTACLIGAACVLLVTVGFTLSAALLA